LVVRVAASAVLVMALAPFLQACIAPGPGGCSREDAPEFSATEEQITRDEVVAVLGEPNETIEIEDGRVDFYEYDRHCVGLLIVGFLPVPVYGQPDQMLTVEYGPDGLFVTANVWPDAETPGEVIASYERRDELAALERARMADVEKRAHEGDPEAMYEHGFGLGMSEQSERLRWYCLAAKHGHAMARYQLGRYHHQGLAGFEGNSERAYRWYTLALEANHADAARYREKLSRDMTPDQIAEAERLVADWEPDSEECEVYVAKARN
jgi:hypothetical protein